MNTDATSLDRLHDIIVPGPVPWWPPAPGWYWVIAFVGVVLLATLIKGFIRWQHNRYRREALAELARQELAVKRPELRSAALLGLSELLKRTALTAFQREQVATLTGPQWFEFLDRTARDVSFQAALGPLLENAVYDPRLAGALEERQIDNLVQEIRRWIEHHDLRLERRANGVPENPPSDVSPRSSLPAEVQPSANSPC